MAEGHMLDEIDEDLNCGFCLQKLTYMIEPKQLPCSHVFCLPCLEEDHKKDCPVCGRIYDADWTGMKSYAPSEGKIGDALYVGNSTNHIFKCDVCKEENSVCYCLNCEQKLCDEHFKLHEQSKVFFPTKHQQIDISVYGVNTGKYKPRYCLSHVDRKLTTACYNCCHLFCSSCNMVEGLCPSLASKPSLGNQHHVTAPIPSMATHMRYELNAKLKDIADEITRGLNLEKKAWDDLHGVEFEVAEFMTKIEDVVEEKIQAVREEGEKLKIELRAYQKKCTEKVEASTKKLREKRDELECLWKSAIDEVKNTSDPEIIADYAAKESEIKTIQLKNHDPIARLSKMRMTCASTPADNKIGIFLMELDELSLTFRKAIATHEPRCYAVTWFGDEILIGVKGGLLAYNMKTLQEKTIDLGLNVNSVKPAGKFSVATLCFKSEQVREIIISDLHLLPNSGSIKCKFNQNSDDLLHVAVSDTHIVVGDTMFKRVIVFNHEGKQVFCLGTGRLKRPWGVLLSGNHLFVSDCDDGCLYKYELTADSQPMWVCKDLHSPSGICDGKDGYLYVASNSRNQVYLVSQEGVLIQELKVHGLSDRTYIHDISISDDGKTLALACREKGVKLFTIERCGN